MSLTYNGVEDSCSPTADANAFVSKAGASSPKYFPDGVADWETMEQRLQVGLADIHKMLYEDNDGQAG